MPTAGVTITADTTAFRRALGRAAKTVDDLKGGFDKASAVAGAFFLKLTIATQLVTNLTGIFDRLRGTLDSTVIASASLARQIGTTASDLQEFNYVAVKTGLTLDRMEDALQEIRLAASESLTGEGGRNVDALKRLGVEVTKLNGELKDSPDLFLEVIDAMNRVIPAAERAGIAAAIFGDDIGTRLNPALDAGSDRLAAFRREARDTGYALDEATVSALVDMNKELGIMSTIMRNEFLKVIAENKDEILDLARAINENLLPVMRALIQSAGAVKVVLGALKEIFVDNTLGALRGLGIIESPQEVHRLPTIETTGTRQRLPGRTTLPPGVDPLQAQAAGIPGAAGPAQVPDSTAADVKSLEQLEQSYKLRFELLQDKHTQELELIDRLEQNRFLTEEGWAQRIAEMRVRIAEQSNRNTLDGYAGFFNDLASLAQFGGEEWLKVAKIGATAQAIISGHESAVHAWKWGMAIGGPPLAGAFMAASVAATAARIHAITATSWGSGGGGGNVATQVPAAQAPTAQAGPGTNVSISLQGRLFSREQVLTLIEDINDAVGAGARLQTG